MDHESATAISILECIAACNEQFISLRIWLRNELKIRTLSRGFECRAYKSGTMIEYYVEAELEGRTICWWLDVTWNQQQWLIQTNVYITVGDGHQDVLKDFPDRVFLSVNDFAEQLTAATSDLVAHARSMDLSPAA